MSNRNRDYTRYSNNSRNKTPEENTNVTPEENTNVKPEENTNVTPEENTNVTPEENTNITPEENTEENTDVESEENTEENTDVESEENTEENTDVESEENANSENNESKIGVVSNCKQLYVREKPDKNSKPIHVLKCETEVEISLEESVDNFYKVCASDNNELITGYCVKDFIEIK